MQKVCRIVFILRRVLEKVKMVYDKDVKRFMVQEKDMKIEWRALHRIQCYLSILNIKNNKDQTKEKEKAQLQKCINIKKDQISTKHLDIDYKKIPKKPKCSLQLLLQIWTEEALREQHCKEIQVPGMQATIADQRETQRLLKAALNVLQDFYGKKAALAQQRRQEPAGHPPPPGFEVDKKNAASGGVMTMFQEIINDAEAMKAEAICPEEDAQKAYEDSVKETNASIDAKSKELPTRPNSMRQKWQKRQ